MSWWAWLLLAWVLLSVPAALLLGLSIRTGQRQEPCAACEHGHVAHEHYRSGLGLCALRLPRLRPPTPETTRARWRGLPIPRRSSG